jgi:2-octaprenyl-6-methoxyphenol hydroxylase
VAESAIRRLGWTGRDEPGKLPAEMATPTDTRADGRQFMIDIAVIGGGLAGLPFAIACAGAGVTVALVDREPPAHYSAAPFDGRSSAIAYGSQRVLDGIGVWRHLAAEAQPILDIRVTDKDSPLFLHYDHRAVGDAPLGWIVENRVLRRALYDRMQELVGLIALAPATLDRADRNAGHVDLALTDGRLIRARLVVAADGRDSALRRAAGIQTLRTDYRQQAISGTVEHTASHRGIAVEHFLPSGPFAILPMTGNRSSIVWTERAERAPALLRLDQDDFELELAHRFGDFLGSVKWLGPRWCYPLEGLVAERIVDRRLALIGDAAHVLHPIAGQGLNLGIRDVAALAELVVDAHRLGLDPGAADLLARYQRWRRVDTLTLTVVTDGLNRLFSNDIGPIKLIRDIGLGLVQQAPPLKRLLMRHAMGLVGRLPRLVRGEAL